MLYLLSGILLDHEVYSTTHHVRCGGIGCVSFLEVLNVLGILCEYSSTFLIAPLQVNPIKQKAKRNPLELRLFTDWISLRIPVFSDV